MISPVWRVMACVAAMVAACLSVAGAGAQVPTVPPPPESSTTVPASAPPPEAPAPAPPPEEGPPPVLDPADTPAPAAPPTTTAPGTPVGASPSSSTTTTRPAQNPVPPARATTSEPSPLRIDLSEIADLRRQAVGKGPRTGRPDSGFDPSLPFQPGAAQPADPGEEPTELGTEEDRIAKVRSLGAVAAGFLALVLLGVAVWVLQQARPEVEPGARP